MSGDAMDPGFGTAPARRGGAARRGRIGLIGLAACAVACGGTAHPMAISPPPARETHAVLAGDLCGDNQCTCRDHADSTDPGVPETATRKRFELRLGPSAHELWATINGTTVLYKSPERAEACFYVDLPTGAQQVELRASNPDGISAAFEIRELGTKTRSWYETFAFRCGAPGVCSFEDLAAQRARYTNVPRQLFDQCGTTKVKGISWDHGAAPDQQHPSELLVRLTLDIYKFAAWKPHGDPTCGQGGGKPPADEPAPPAE